MAPRSYHNHTGVPVETVLDARITEALKLWDTAQLGVSVLLEKEIHRWCEAHNVPFEWVYSHANETYNTGYRLNGKKHYQRPILEHRPGPIGGHCVMRNAMLLDSWAASLILDKGSRP